MIAALMGAVTFIWLAYIALGALVWLVDAPLRRRKARAYRERREAYERAKRDKPFGYHPLPVEDD